MTLEQAKNLKYGQILYHSIHRNADGTPQRWRVNGRVKTWKRDSSKVEVPVKHGLKSFDYVTEKNLELLHLTEGMAKR